MHYKCPHFCLFSKIFQTFCLPLTKPNIAITFWPVLFGRLMKYYRVRFSIILFITVLIDVNAAPGKETPSPEAWPQTFVFTDSAQRQVELPVQIRRVVPSGALAQMFLLAVAPDLICAVSSAYGSAEAEFVPAYFVDLPVAGQFYGAANLNPEEIARIGPDLVIDVGEPKDTIARDYG
jgi:iron complex transport system substrate-binding protein